MQLVKTGCLQIGPFRLQSGPISVFFRSIGLDLQTLDETDGNGSTEQKQNSTDVTGRTEKNKIIGKNDIEGQGTDWNRQEQTETDRECLKQIST